MKEVKGIVRSHILDWLATSRAGPPSHRRFSQSCPRSEATLGRGRREATKVGRGSGPKIDP